MARTASVNPDANPSLQNRPVLPRVLFLAWQARTNGHLRAAGVGSNTGVFQARKEKRTTERSMAPERR